MVRMGIVTLAVCALVAGLAAADSSDTLERWLVLGEQLAGDVEADLAVDAGEPAPTVAPSAAKPPPLPLHNIEGYGGGPVTSVAYMCNPGAEGDDCCLPSVSYTFLGIGGEKYVNTLAISQTLFKRFELAYAFSHFRLGTVPSEIRKRGLNVHRNEVFLHTFTGRVMVIREGEFDQPWMPAVTFGAHLKTNVGIEHIDNQTGGALTGVGLKSATGWDFTLVASKTLPPDILGVPVILSLGARSSEAAQIGYLGFGDDREITIEASVIGLVTNWLALGYEFRQKANPYDVVPGLLGDDDSWHVLFAGLMLSDRLTLAGGWAWLGDVGNTPDTCGWAVQLKYEF